MKNMKTRSISLFILLCSSNLSLKSEVSTAASTLERGAIVMKLNFDADAERGAWTKPQGIQWEQTGTAGPWCLATEIAKAKPGDKMASRTIDLTPWRGLALHFQCKAKADDVTQPAEPYNGVKFMLHFKAPSGERWTNQNNIFGTFDWKPLDFTLAIPEDAGKAELCLGLQDASGKALFKEIMVTVSRPRPPKRPTPDPKAPPAYKGHDLQRLRGVMSPNASREEDLRVLGTEWNANLIRWQLTRAWGKANTDRDLDEYDQWIDRRLDELQKTLVACQKYNIKVVIDLHSPPGGRDEESDMTMFYDKKYQDHFVKTWEKIARRLKDSPALWAYDLVNEPVCKKPTALEMDSLATQVRAARAIRAIDAKTAIVIESENWDSPDAFAWLTPVNVPNVIYQVHMYVPHEYTHQGVHSPAPLITYPGKIGAKAYDKEALRQILAPVREFQQAYNVHIYAGEFSAIRWAPGAARYLADCIDLFEEYGWDWSYHAYREWPGWSVEHENLPASPDIHKPAATDTDRKQVLLNWFIKNQKPARL